MASILSMKGCTEPSIVVCAGATAETGLMSKRVAGLVEQPMTTVNTRATR
jgi:hypothetical protein